MNLKYYKTTHSLHKILFITLGLRAYFVHTIIYNGCINCYLYDAYNIVQLCFTTTTTHFKSDYKSIFY